MEFPQITPWDENRLKLSEKMKVLQRFRYNQNGKIVKMKPGDPIELKGEEKKDLYHQLKVSYPADYDALTKYFEEQRKTGNAVEYKTPPSVAKATDVDKLIGQVAELTEKVDAQANENAELKKRIAALSTAPDEGKVNASDNKKSGGKKQ